MECGSLLPPFICAKLASRAKEQACLRTPNSTIAIHLKKKCSYKQLAHKSLWDSAFNIFLVLQTKDKGSGVCHLDIYWRRAG
jgi:hypothetical protein